TTLLINQTKGRHMSITMKNFRQITTVCTFTIAFLLTISITGKGLIAQAVRSGETHHAQNKNKADDRFHSLINIHPVISEESFLIQSPAVKLSDDDDKKQKKKRNKKKKSIVKNPQPVPEFTIPDKIEGESYVYFIAIGDQGTGEVGQYKVALLMDEKARKDSLHFVLTLGDNIYSDGVKSVHDSQWQKKFIYAYDHANLDVTFYSTLGNHDHHKNRAPFQVEFGKINKKWYMPAQYYTFAKKIDATHTIQFFALDTTPWVSNKSARVEQMIWLENELKKSLAIWKIVFGHHPVFSYGEHGHEKNLIAELRPLLEEYDVDLYINGHDHDRQFLKPVGGVHYITSGTGAKSRDAAYGPLTIFAETNLGFTYYRVSASQMHVQFINGEGEIEFAHTWEKGSVAGKPFVASEIGGKINGKKKNKKDKKRKKYKNR
ncbi:MAG: metallophosphoesterase, partial [bacterium]